MLRRFLPTIALLAILLAPSPVRAEDRPPLVVRVVTFNVLCSFCDRANYDPWSDRLAQFGDIFARHRPDLIGLQEISKAEEVEEILPHAPGFAAIHYADPPDSGPKPRAYPDATILYRTDRFEAVESGAYWLSETPDEPWSRGWAKAAFWRLVAWAHFREKATGRDLFFATTHFDNNQPNQPMSAPLVLERTAPWAERMPCIFTGDFNSKPDSPAYATLAKGKDGAGFRFANAFDLVPEFSIASNEDPKPEYDPAHRIDHIWLAGPGKFDAREWTVDLTKYGPKNRFPSDHRAMSAEIVFE